MMKRILLYLTITVLCTSCEMETSHNGDLDGFWLLSTVDTLSTRGHADVEDRSLTWSFQGHLLELRALKGERYDFICRFSHSGDSLKLGQPYISEGGHNDIPVGQVNDSLRVFGFHRLTPAYAVLTLNSSKMVLCSEELLLTFRKY